MQTLIERRPPDRFGRFHEGLAVRGYPSYAAYLASDAWRQFWTWYRRSGLPQRCLICGSTNFELHHWNYGHIGQEDPCDVVPLCRKHHHRVHEHLAQHGGDVREFERHLRDVFELTATDARKRFRPFRRMHTKLAHQSRCVDCRKRLGQQHPHCRCWKCHKAWCQRGGSRRGRKRAKPIVRTVRIQPKPAVACPECGKFRREILPTGHCKVCERRRRKKEARSLDAKRLSSPSALREQLATRRRATRTPA